MLTRLRFRNFKAWPDSGNIRMAPLTVLFGTNSAGKTSIPQLLLLMKQTAASPDRQRALQLGDGRALVELGAYEDIVHRHDVAQPLDIELEWTAREVLHVEDPVSGAEYSGSRFSFRVRIDADRRRQPRVRSFCYGLSGENGPGFEIEMRRAEGGRTFDLKTRNYRLVRHPGRTWPIPAPFRFYGFPDEVTAYFQNARFTSDLVLALEKQLGSIYYLGPLRDYPSRLYVWSGEEPEHVGAKGERAIEAMLAGRERIFSVGPGDRKKPLPELVASRLRAMGLIKEFKVAPLGRHRKEYEVLVKTAPHMPEVKLTDVGFGISQVLPVIVECFYVPERSVVIVEQPEIHLHPKVQADLADLFVDAINAREDGRPRRCQFIVESHSEHFLRRLQRRVAERALSHEDCALHFVYSHRGRARLQPLDLDSFGNIKNWPQDFFGDEMADLVARTKAQADRLSATERDR